MKTKYFIFNLLFADYESQILILEGNSINEIVEKYEELQDCKIKNFNYNPKNDIDKFSYLNTFDNSLFKSESVDFRNKNYKNHEVFNNNYETLLLNSKYTTQGVSGELFLETNEEFYDYFEIYGNFPKNYKFSDGHSG